MGLKRAAIINAGQGTFSAILRLVEILHKNNMVPKCITGNTLFSTFKSNIMQHCTVQFNTMK